MESRPGMRMEQRPGRNGGDEEEAEEEERRSKWTLKWIFFSPHEECRHISGEASLSQM